MGLALLVVIWLITLVSTYFFVAKTWWLPVGASAAAGFIDGQFALTLVLMGIVFLAAQLSSGLLCVEIPGAAFVPAGELFTRQCEAGSGVDGVDYGSVHRIESDGKQRVGCAALRPGGAGRGAG